LRPGASETLASGDELIISASYKTDIPTFYGEWFIRRLRAGYCRMVNPYGGQVYRVPLDRASVDGFVFWTKNISPFMRHLREVRDRGCPFVVQYTINGYPRTLETSVVDAERSIAAAQEVREEYGQRALVWRYDTVLSTSLTPPEFHAANFARLASRLEGATDEVVVSFAQIYKKTRRNLDVAAHAEGFVWTDPDAEAKRRLLTELRSIARSHKMQLTVCSQRELLIDGVGDARCIDARRLGELGGAPLATRLKGNRPDCGCFESRDIGGYDTCPHGCVYCYAVQTRELALERYRRHDPDSEFLFTPPSRLNAAPESADVRGGNDRRAGGNLVQLRLLGDADDEPAPPRSG
jgi:hypothetical protein